jgi:hypothetical protein
MNKALRRIERLKDMLSLILGYLGLALLLGGVVWGFAILYFTRSIKRKAAKGVQQPFPPLGKASML